METLQFVAFQGIIMYRNGERRVREAYEIKAAQFSEFSVQQTCGGRPRVPGGTPKWLIIYYIELLSGLGGEILFCNLSGTMWCVEGQIYNHSHQLTKEGAVKICLLRRSPYCMALSALTKMKFS